MDWNAQIHVLHVASLMLGAFAAGVGVGCAAMMWRIRETRKQLRMLHKMVKGEQVMNRDAAGRRKGKTAEENKNKKKTERRARRATR